MVVEDDLPVSLLLVQGDIGYDVVRLVRAGQTIERVWLQLLDEFDVLTELAAGKMQLRRHLGVIA